MSAASPAPPTRKPWRKVRDLLTAAKPSWIAMNYGTVESYAKGDFSPMPAGTVPRSGAAAEPGDQVRLPKEGFPIWMDSVGILADAQNVENAKLFQNFIMARRTRPSISAFARYANGIKGSEQFMPADMQDAPELTLPEATRACSSRPARRRSTR